MWYNGRKEKQSTAAEKICGRSGMYLHCMRREEETYEYISISGGEY